MSLQPIDYYDCDKLGLDAKRPLLQRETKAIEIMGKYKPTAKKLKMLDIGCGDGFFLTQADAALGSQYIYHGVDYSEFKVREASKLPYEFKRCNLEDGIPYPDESFDVVYSGEVIEHIYNPDYMIEECRRVLKPGGLLVISTPNLQAWYNRALFIVGIQPLFYEVSTKSSHIGAGVLKRLKHQTVPVGHLRVFNRRGLVDLIENEGFVVDKVQGAMFQAFPRPIQAIDNLFNVRPSLASNLVVTAHRKA